MDEESYELKDAMYGYFHEEVSLDKVEVNAYRRDVLPTLDKLIQEVHNKDRLFRNEAVYDISFCQQLKVNDVEDHNVCYVIVGGIDTSVDDVDNQRFYGFNKLQSNTRDPLLENLQMKKMPGLSLPPAPQGAYFLRQQAGRLRQDITFDGDLVPFLVRRKLRRLIKDAHNELNLTGDILEPEGLHQSVVTLALQTNAGEIKVGFVPLVRAGLPFTDWPGQRTQWHDWSAIEEVQESGLSLVAKQDFYWTECYTEAEDTLIRGEDSDDPDEGRRLMVLRILKKLNYDNWNDSGDPILTSDMLKNVWFHECERHSDECDWSSDNIVRRLMGLVNRLLRYLENGRINQWLNPSVNLLEDIDGEKINEVAEDVRDFLDNPLEGLRA